jgi:hypothetical protein
MEVGRRSTERWFVVRGVPQLIEGYSSEQRMDARAAPFIAGWIVLGTLFVWGPRPGATAMDRLLATGLALALTIIGVGIHLTLRRRWRSWRRFRLDVLDIALLGAVPGIVAAVLDGSIRSLFGVGGVVLIGIGVIYLVTGFGLLEIAFWALRHLRAQLSQISRLVAGTLPILLILVVFLLFASELWQAAHTLGGADLAAVIGLFLAVATLLVVTRAGEEVRLIETRLDRGEIGTLVVDTPVAAAAIPDASPPLRWPERVNLVALMLVSQLVQSLFVAILIVVFLVALGILAIPASVQATWVTPETVRPVLSFELLGEPRLVSVELLIAAGLLGGMCGLYFTGLALTDAAYRAEFHANVVAEVEQILAVRATYRAMPGVTRRSRGSGS